MMSISSLGRLASCLPLLLALLLAVFSTLTSALPSATGNRVLVVIDTAAKDTYSTFFSTLTTRGYKLDFKAPRAEKPLLVQHDVPSYDHLILLTPSSKGLAADLQPQQLVEYLKNGGNMIVGLDSSISEMQRDLAREFSLEFEERGSALVDHFRFDPLTDAGNHTAVLVGGKATVDALSPGGLMPNPNVFSEKTLEAAKDKPLLYRGLAHRVGSNPLAFPLILPPATAYSSEVPSTIKEQNAFIEETRYVTPAPVTITTTRIVDDETTTAEVVSTPRPSPTVVKTKKGTKLGKNGWIVEGRDKLPPLERRRELVAGLSTPSSNAIVSLVSAFQLATNSARAVFLGSTDVLSDASLSNPNTINGLVAGDLASWAFQEKSVLKVVATNHHRVKSSESDTREDYEETDEGNKMYRIKDTVFYSLDLIQHTPDQGWMPAERTLPIQINFRMLDPYITAYLTPLDPADYSASSPLGASGEGSKAFTRFATTFQIPDRHGVFTFDLNFKRAGLTFLDAKDTAPVRPFNHDEYPRFLSSSWPYIAGAFSTVAGFLVFVFIWLTIRDDVGVDKKTK